MRDSDGRAEGEDDGLTDQQRIIIDALCDRHQIGTKDVASLLNVQERRALVLLSELLDRGPIRRIGNGRSTRYALSNLPTSRADLSQA